MTEYKNVGGILCRKCGHKRRADEEGSLLQCPACGAYYHKVAERLTDDDEAPRPRRRSVSAPLAAGVIGAVVVIAVVAAGDWSRSPPDECGVDNPGCYHERFIYPAQRACRPEVEAFAKYQSEWDYSLDGMFDAYVVADDGTIRFIGDRVKFQNGFGAWRWMRYECTFDPATKSAWAIVTER